MTDKNDEAPLPPPRNIERAKRTLDDWETWLGWYGGVHAKMPAERRLLAAKMMRDLDEVCFRYIGSPAALKEWRRIGHGAGLELEWALASLIAAKLSFIPDKEKRIQRLSWLIWDTEAMAKANAAGEHMVAGTESVQ